MQPAFAAITFRRGDTPSLGVILDGRHIRSGEIVRLPRVGDVISWTIGWPNGSATKTTVGPGGLIVDPRTGAIAYPVTDADVANLGNQTAAFVVQVIRSNGRKTTYLTGTLNAEG